jgi:hypothetical protein
LAVVSVVPDVTVKLAASIGGADRLTAAATRAARLTPARRYDM